MTWIPCSRCHQVFCQCAQVPQYPQCPQQLGQFTFIPSRGLSDEDVKRIADAVVDKMKKRTRKP